MFVATERDISTVPKVDTIWFEIRKFYQLVMKSFVVLANKEPSYSINRKHVIGVDLCKEKFL